MLDPKLQDGKKIPKWNRRSRLGQFMGFSDEHSSLVANVRHLTTGFVSPQYHVVFDDLFQTVFSSGCNDALVDTICNNLFDCNRDVYAADEFDSSGNIVYHPPPLDEVWLDESERRDRRVLLRRQKEITEERERSKRLHIPAPTSPPEPAPDDNDPYIPPLSLFLTQMMMIPTLTLLLHHIKREKLVILVVLLILGEMLVQKSKNT